MQQMRRKGRRRAGETQRKSVQVGDSAGSRVHRLHARETNEDERVGKNQRGLTFPTGYPRACSQTPYLRIDTQFPASLAPIGRGIVAPDRRGPFRFQINSIMVDIQAAKSYRGVGRCSALGTRDIERDFSIVFTLIDRVQTGKASGCLASPRLVWLVDGFDPTPMDVRRFTKNVRHPPDLSISNRRRRSFIDGVERLIIAARCMRYVVLALRRSLCPLNFVLSNFINIGRHKFDGNSIYVYRFIMKIYRLTF